MFYQKLRQTKFVDLFETNNFVFLRPTTDRQIDRQTLSYKPFFLTQGVSKRKDLMKISKVIFHIKPIPSHP